MGQTQSSEKIDRDEAFDKIVYMLEKFQLLVKSYYSLFEQIEQRGPTCQEEIDKLRKAYNHLEEYKDKLEKLKN